MAGEAKTKFRTLTIQELWRVSSEMESGCEREQEVMLAAALNYTVASEGKGVTNSALEAGLRRLGTLNQRLSSRIPLKVSSRTKKGQLAIK